MKQKQGKGTNGNIWESSPKGESLLFSIVLDYKIDVIKPCFSFLPAIALINVLKNYNINAHVKWPNDVLIGNKKVCGILCEGVANKKIVVGIGINVNQHYFSRNVSDKAISIKQYIGYPLNIEDVLKEYLFEFEKLHYSNVNIRNLWIQNSNMINKKITAIKDEKKIIVTVIGISSDGYLQIKQENGQVEEWNSRYGLDILQEY